ncbi:MAG TPA: hypothetical protein VE866_02705 [Candidatus Binatia bacterium]|nr:hypothetical protein [Candidatus Binatia bacterium]
MDSKQTCVQHNPFENLGEYLSNGLYVAVIAGSLLAIVTDGFSRGVVPFHLSRQGTIYSAFLSIALLESQVLQQSGRTDRYHRRLCMVIAVILAIQSIALNPRVYAVIHGLPLSLISVASTALLFGSILFTFTRRTTPAEPSPENHGTD